MNLISIYLLVTLISLISGLTSMIIMAYDKKRLQLWGKIAIISFILTIACIISGLTYLFLIINDIV